jgi:signal transduction histidine kinase
MVAERTRALEAAQAELLVKERLAVLGHFAGSVSHELRNPLAVIESSAYLLNQMSAGADDKLKTHLGKIRDNVRKSNNIIESLINLSRMEKPKTEKHDLAHVVSMSLDSSRIPETVEVHLNCPEQDVFVHVDPEQIRMALKNIIGNAVQAMEGSGELTLSVQASGDGPVELTVADTGPGIAPENLGKVFDPLFSTKTHGIGFGLSITKMIIENHGGTIRAEGEPGSGAVFIITFPHAGSP